MQTAGCQKQQYQQQNSRSRPLLQQLQVIHDVMPGKHRIDENNNCNCKQVILIAFPELPEFPVFVGFFRIRLSLAQLVACVVQQTAGQDNILGASGQFAQYRNLCTGRLVDQCQCSFTSFNMLANVCQFQYIALCNLLIICFVDKGQRQNACIDQVCSREEPCP